MTSILRIGLPKGRMEQGVLDLLTEAGIRVHPTARNYRPDVRLPATETKFLKAQNIVEMLMLGSRDVGFAGADWVAELSADVVEVLDTGLDPVDIVAAAPADLLDDGRLPRRPLVVASEYERLAQGWMRTRAAGDAFVRSYGATEVFPPEDADVIVDNAATGSTLRANGLVVVDTLMASTTRLYASPAAMRDPGRRRRIEDLHLVLTSVLEARRRVMVEVNASADVLDRVVAALPCMRQPTVSPLYGNGSYAVKAAVPRDVLAQVIPAVKAAGGSDVVVSTLAQIVP
ncbi:MAG: ATP phosphoribosyltransferase [Gemmatimonadaceae bacterium]|nr:ATP phosphoribosyltransferase [Gemmatimonadaceae bacterium]